MAVVKLLAKTNIKAKTIIEASGLWEFPQPTSGTTLTGFYVRTTGNVPCSVDWGDGNIEVINSASPTNHTY